MRPTNASKHARKIMPERPPEQPKSSLNRSKMAPGGLPDASRRLSQQNVDFRAILRSKLRPCWDPKNCLKSTKTRKKKFQDSFSIAKRRKMMTRDPLQEEGPEQGRQKAWFCMIFEHFSIIFWKTFASSWPACDLRKKCTKNSSSPPEFYISPCREKIEKCF